MWGGGRLPVGNKLDNAVCVSFMSHPRWATGAERPTADAWRAVATPSARRTAAPTATRGTAGAGAGPASAAPPATSACPDSSASDPVSTAI